MMIMIMIIIFIMIMIMFMTIATNMIIRLILLMLIMVMMIIMKTMKETTKTVTITMITMENNTLANKNSYTRPIVFNLTHCSWGKTVAILQRNILFPWLDTVFTEICSQYPVNDMCGDSIGPHNGMMPNRRYRRSSILRKSSKWLYNRDLFWTGTYTTIQCCLQYGLEQSNMKAPSDYTIA